jgi:hypothetical protein
MTDEEILHADVARLPWVAQAEEEKPQKAKPGDLELWSVTLLLRQMGDPGGLVAWAANKTAASAVEDEAIWQAMADKGQVAEAKRYLAGARFRPRPGCTLTDADAGTLFHKKAEQWVYEGSRPACDVAEVNLLLDSYGKWLDRAQPTFSALEMTVYNPEDGYAGTLDAIIKEQGRLYLVDYKTSLDLDEGRKRKQPWPTVAPQLAAYRYAPFYAMWKARMAERYSRRYYLLSEEERRLAQPMPEITGGYCLHISPVHADLYPVATGEDIYTNGFLAAVDAANWTLRMADTAIDTEGALLLDTA